MPLKIYNRIERGSGFGLGLTLEYPKKIYNRIERYLIMI